MSTIERYQTMYITVKNIEKLIAREFRILKPKPLEQFLALHLVSDGTILNAI